MPVPPSTSQYHLVTHSWANWTIFSSYNSFVVDRCPHPAARRWAGNQPSCPQNKNKNQYQQLSLWTAGNGLFTVRQLLGIYWTHSHTWELSFFYRDETLTNFFFRSAVDIDNARCGYFYSNCFNRSTQLSGPWCLWQFFVKFISLKRVLEQRK